MGNEFFIGANFRAGVICGLNMTTNTNNMHSTSILNFCDNSVVSNTILIDHSPKEVKSFGWNGKVFAISKCDNVEISSLADVYNSSFWNQNVRMFYSENMMSCARYGSSTSWARTYFVIKF